MARKRNIDYDDWDVEGYEDVPKRQVRKKSPKKTSKQKKSPQRYQQERIYPNIEGYDPYRSNPYANQYQGDDTNNGFDNMNNPSNIRNPRRNKPHDARLDEIRRDRDVDDGEDMRILSSLRKSQNPQRNSVYGDGYEDQYDEWNDDEYELDVEGEHHLGTVTKIIIGILIAIGAFGLFIFWGYWNTDFDQNGTAYVVPLELHYERHYLQEADKVLQMMLDIDKTLAEDTAQLPTNYSEKSTLLTKEMNELKSQTTSFSKYVNVPDNFQTYHSLLINFSLKTQEFMKNLLNNYSSSDYDAFRQSGLKDYESYFYSVKQARRDLESIAFGNMSSHKGILSEESNKTSEGLDSNSTENNAENSYNQDDSSQIDEYEEDNSFSNSTNDERGYNSQNPSNLQDSNNQNNGLQNKQSDSDSITNGTYNSATNNVVNQQIIQDSANSGLAN